MEELIDVLTPSGDPTGIRKTKSAIHRDGDWHRAAHVWIVTPRDHVILQLRSKRKTNYPGMWDVSAAGHVSAGETAVECAIRETREEIGIEVAAGDLKPIGVFRQQLLLRNGAYIDNEIDETFVVRKDVREEDVVLDGHEVDGFVFVPVEELRRRVASDPTLVPHAEEYAALFVALVS